MTRQQDIEKHMQETGEAELEQEWQEYHRRVRTQRCTCDLLEPYGHVTCPSCNESIGDFL